MPLWIVRKSAAYCDRRLVSISVMDFAKSKSPVFLSFATNAPLVI
eukprot:XP_001706776.1 Hypothetical protein GL50803_32079 [Giardia lamblia ATCC 50803]